MTVYNKAMGVAGALAAMGITKEKPPYKKKPSKGENPEYFKGHPGIKNPKQAAQVNEMHEKWKREQFPSRVHKKDADPESISSIKQKRGCHRGLARMLKEQGVG